MYIGNNMVWRSIFISFLIHGALAQYEETGDTIYLRDLVKQECARNHAVDKADDVMDSILGFVNCTNGLMNLDVFEREVVEARKHGALDEVIRKYCVKSPQLMACINGLVDGISPCIYSSYWTQVLNGKAFVDQLLDLVCYKDGDIIAIFMAEDGPECFIQKRFEIQQCFINANASIDSLAGIQSLLFNEQCNQYDKLSECVVKSLHSCPTPIPGNVIDSLLRYVREGLPCMGQEE